MKRTPKTKGSIRSPVAKHRARKAHGGFVRVEVSVRKEDARLVRDVAAALSDPMRRTVARRVLRERFAEPPHISLKMLLAAAPLDGIELARPRDLGRNVEL